MIDFSFVMKPLVIVVALSACETETNSTRIDVTRGKELFESQCAACHGANAKGAGPESLGLGAPPPSLRQLAKKNNGVFPRTYVLAIIDGRELHNNPFAAMPVFGAQDMGPLIQVETGGLTTPIPANMLALAAYIKSLQD
jgi:mono/diheme cytochrome c family protein